MTFNWNCHLNGAATHMTATMLKYFSNELLSANWYIPVGYFSSVDADD